MIHDPETTAILVACLLRAGCNSQAAYAVIKVPDNGRRALVRILVEKITTEPQIEALSRGLSRFMAEDEVFQGALTT